MVPQLNRTHLLWNHVPLFLSPSQCVSVSLPDISPPQLLWFSRLASTLWFHWSAFGNFPLSKTQPPAEKLEKTGSPSFSYPIISRCFHLNRQFVKVYNPSVYLGGHTKADPLEHSMLQFHNINKLHLRGNMFFSQVPTGLSHPALSQQAIVAISRDFIASLVIAGVLPKDPVPGAI